MDATEQAMIYIINCCRNIGSFFGTTAANDYLKIVALDIETSRPSILFPERYNEHVAYAMNLIASNDFLSPPSAIASVYLATRFEFYFRILSGRLNADGTWKTNQACKDSKWELPKVKLNDRRINNVAVTYKIMKLNKSLKVSTVCETIDKEISSKQKGANTDIGDRIKTVRDSSAHGEIGDISAESIFYGMLTAVIFYNQA